MTNAKVFSVSTFCILAVVATLGTVAQTGAAHGPPQVEKVTVNTKPVSMSDSAIWHSLTIEDL